MGFGWGKQRNKSPGCHTDIVGIGVVGIVAVVTAVVGTAAFGIAVAFRSETLETIFTEFGAIDNVGT